MMPGRDRYALICMPWFWAYLPSIQLAIVADVLDRCDVETDVYEFYTDFVAATGMHLYKAIANASGPTGELLFSQFYFDGHRQQYATGRPDFGLGSAEVENAIFDFMTPLVEDHLDRWHAEVDWDLYSTVCFSLTAAQTAASMAMAKRIKASHPHLRIVFGGSSCAGEMGAATARICPEIDVVVHGEAESSLPQLVQAFRGERELAAVPGISWRCGAELATNARAPLHPLARTRGPLNFDAYFERIAGNDVLEAYGTWIPFESSRGCWYGEKAQCTFCGLNEIIHYRERGANGLVEELEDYARRYGATRFFAVDLIMPRSFFSDFLPAVAAAEKPWTIFYEIKSNMTREQIERLAEGRVRWIQPGIESLDDEVLGLMRKGVSAIQNILTLKWSEEFDIVASWNLITGFPRQSAASYHRMAALCPKLHHLLPPVGMGDFEVHRFSPYFENPARHGIELLGADPIYRHVFPVAEPDLNDLVYRHAYRLTDPPDAGLGAARSALLEAVAAWREARLRKARFTMQRQPDGGARLVDTRRSSKERVTKLEPAPARLLEFLDTRRPEARLADLFAATDPASLAALGGADGLARTIDHWVAQDVVLRLGGHLLGLPIRIAPQIHDRRRRERDGTEARCASGNDGHDQGAALQS